MYIKFNLTLGQFLYGSELLITNYLQSELLNNDLPTTDSAQRYDCHECYLF